MSFSLCNVCLQNLLDSFKYTYFQFLKWNKKLKVTQHFKHTLQSEKQHFPTLVLRNISKMIIDK